MALLLTPAAVLRSSEQQFQRSQSSRALPLQLFSGCSPVGISFVAQDRVVCNNSIEGVAVGSRSSTSSIGGAVEQDLNSSPDDDKAYNPCLDLLTDLNHRRGSSEAPQMDDALRTSLFVGHAGDKQPSWVDRRTAVQVLQYANNLESALTRVGDNLEVSDLNLLLRRLGSVGRWDDACQLFEWMEKESRLSVSSYCIFITMLGEVGRLVKAFSVYNPLQEELKLNPAIASSMLTILVNNWKIARAFRLFRQLKKLGFKHDHKTYSTMLYGCLKVHNGFEKAEEIHEEMKASGFVPDAEAYGALLRVYCAEGIEGKVKALVDEMSLEGVSLTLDHYSYLMNLYARLNRPEDAEHIFSEIKEAGLEPNAIVYRSLLNVYGWNGMLEKARKAFDEIQASGMYPDMIMYSFLINALVNAKKVYEAHEVLIQMRKHGVRPGGNAYSILIWGYGQLGDLEMVNKLAAECETRQRGKQDVRVYNALLRAYADLNDDDGITNTLNTMDTQNILPNVGSFNILIGYLCSKRMPALALRTYKDMKCRGLRANEVQAYEHFPSREVGVLFVLQGTYSKLILGLLESVLADRPKSPLSIIMERTRERGNDLLAEAHSVFRDMQSSKQCCHQPALERFIQVNAMYRNWAMALEGLGELRKSRYKAHPSLIEELLSNAEKNEEYEVVREVMNHLVAEEIKIDTQVLERLKIKLEQIRDATITGDEGVAVCQEASEIIQKNF